MTLRPCLLAGFTHRLPGRLLQSMMLPNDARTVKLLLRLDKARRDLKTATICWWAAYCPHDGEWYLRAKAAGRTEQRANNACWRYGVEKGWFTPT